MVARVKNVYNIVSGMKAEHAGALFLMRAGDFRMPSGEYEVVTGGRLTAGSVPAPNGSGRRCKVFVGDDGRRYAVFTGWSVRRA